MTLKLLGDDGGPSLSSLSLARKSTHRLGALLGKTPLENVLWIDTQRNGKSWRETTGLG